MIRQIAVTGILVFLFLAYVLNSTEVSITFNADWDGPFFTVFMGKVGGYLPDQFSFHEAAWKNHRRREEFFMALDDKEGKAWARLHSDTTQESAVWLPRKPKEVLNADIIRFVSTLRNMFKDSSRHIMRGAFAFGKRKLIAEAREFTLSQDEAQKFRHDRAFTVLTFDTTGTPDIRGRVVVHYDNVIHYHKVAIFLPEDEIEVTLEEQKEH